MTFCAAAPEHRWRALLAQPCAVDLVLVEATNAMPTQGRGAPCGDGQSADRALE